MEKIKYDELLKEITKDIEIESLEEDNITKT